MSGPATALVMLLGVLVPHALVALTVGANVPLTVGVPLTVIVLPTSADAERPAGSPETVALVALASTIVPL